MIQCGHRNLVQLHHPHYSLGSRFEICTHGVEDPQHIQSGVMMKTYDQLDSLNLNLTSTHG